MRRFILPVAAIALTAACGSAESTPVPAHSSASNRAAAASTNSAHKATKPKPARSKGCGTERDVIAWYKVPGIPDSAQVLGNYNLASCETTFHSIQTTSPTGPGYCTEAAWASDNPGYNADADVAKRLSKVQVSVGPAC